MHFFFSLLVQPFTLDDTLQDISFDLSMSGTVVTLINSYLILEKHMFIFVHYYTSKQPIPIWDFDIYTKVRIFH